MFPQVVHIPPTQEQATMSALLNDLRTELKYAKAAEHKAHLHSAIAALETLLSLGY
jgi:hypothetical protein